MSKLDELDKGFDEEFKNHSLWLDVEEGLTRWTSKDKIKTFARKYYDLGRLEEREALKERLMEAKYRFHNPKEECECETCFVINPLLSTLNNKK